MKKHCKNIIPDLKSQNSQIVFLSEKVACKQQGTWSCTS